MSALPERVYEEYAAELERLEAMERRVQEVYDRAIRADTGLRWTAADRAVAGYIFDRVCPRCANPDLRSLRPGGDTVCALGHEQDPPPVVGERRSTIAGPERFDGRAWRRISEG